METFDSLLPNIEQRFCVSHLYANFRMKFKDKDLRDAMWVQGHIEKMNSRRKWSI